MRLSVHIPCVHTGVSNQSLVVVPGDIRWSDTVTLVVDEDFDLSALHDTDTGVGGTQINTDDWTSNGGVLERSLVLSLGWSTEENHWSDENEEKVQDSRPRKAGLCPRVTSHLEVDGRVNRGVVAAEGEGSRVFCVATIKQRVSSN